MHGYDLCDEIVSFSCRFLDPWLKWFNLNETLLVVNHDDIINDPYSVVHRVEQFLGIVPRIKQEWIYFDKQRGFHCKYTDYDENISECMPNNKGRTHATVPLPTVKLFHEFYQPWNNKFFQQIGQDFGWNS